MLFRFSLYGFLKNQQYFEPFLILAFLEKGLSFTAIGFLIGFREVCIYLMEIPTGAIADVFGKRISMICSHISYILSFILFAFSNTILILLIAMFCFAVGEAFRTGTHKAIIFRWLEFTGRQSEKTKVYGFTRSWSKMGSAVNALVAAVFVFIFQNFQIVFLVSIVPYVINIINFLTYPKIVENDNLQKSLPKVGNQIIEALKRSFRFPDLRGLMVESLIFEGYFKASKDYLQPVLKTWIVALPVLLIYQEEQRIALLVGIVYFLLYFLSSIASRHACWFERLCGNMQNASKQLWIGFLMIYTILGSGVLFGSTGLFISVLAFILLFVLQNFWRPILISRIADQIESDKMATILSVESQVKTLGAAIFAPALGFMVDRMSPNIQFLPIGIAGSLLGLLILSMMYHQKNKTSNWF